MKLAVLLSLILFGFSVADAQQPINWLTDFREANRVAVQTGKPMLLDFTASWCKPCREMEQIFWTRGDVVERAKNFVCVKIDLDRNAKLADKYGVSSLPNVIMTDSWGNGLMFHRGFGRNAVAEINEKLDSVPIDFSEIKKANDTLATKKNDSDALRKIGDFYQDKKVFYLSSDFYARLLKQEKDSSKRENLTLTLGFNYLKIGWTDEAKNVFGKFQKDFPASAQTDAALFGAFSAAAQKNSLDEAGRILNELKAKFPKSDFIAQAERNLQAYRLQAK